MECNYCGKEVEKSKGKMLVQSSGKRLFFCSGKCQKNFKRKKTVLLLRKVSEKLGEKQEPQLP